MNIEVAKKYILANYFDGMENVKAVVGGDEEIMAMKLAVEALEKQIPKKPLIWRGIKTPESPIPFDDWGYECPCCGNQEIDYPDHHCECGQALDWSEENDTAD